MKLIDEFLQLSEPEPVGPDPLPPPQFGVYQRAVEDLRVKFNIHLDASYDTCAAIADAEAARWTWTWLK